MKKSAHSLGVSRDELAMEGENGAAVSEGEAIEEPEDDADQIVRDQTMLTVVRDEEALMENAGDRERGVDDPTDRKVASERTAGVIVLKEVDRNRVNLEAWNVKIPNR